MRRHWIAVARGDEPADLVLRGGSVLSVFSGEVFRADVAIVDGHVVGVGNYDGGNSRDVTGKFVVPGFIDGHCHIESSKLGVDEFARAVLRSGTTAVVVDPHEIANVLGTKGLHYILEATEGIPLSVFVKMPPCVPASPFESADASLEACDFSDLLQHPRVWGIAEMMNYPGVIAAEPALLSKMALTDFARVDGHAPGLTGQALNAYLVSGAGSDHECTDLAEALEKKRLGMWIMIREASMIRNLRELLPLVRDYGTENCMFCTDDREAGTLLGEGHMNAIVRKAVELGLSVSDAVKLASLNVARFHGLPRMGAVAPGYRADLMVLSDLESFRPEAVFTSGRLVAEAGEVVEFPGRPVPESVRHSVHILPVEAADFQIPYEGAGDIRVVELIQDQVVTKASTSAAVVRNSMLVADAKADLVKLAVVERHHSSGRIGHGFVRGFGLRRGAFASTVAHDAHNIVVAGVDDDDMALAVNRLAEIDGGLVVVQDGQIVGELPLEVAGLMSTLPAADVAEALEKLETDLGRMGVRLATPFMYLGFLALSVIPELRVTDMGVVDVRQFELVPLEIS